MTSEEHEQLSSREAYLATFRALHQRFEAAVSLHYPETVLPFEQRSTWQRHDDAGPVSDAELDEWEEDLPFKLPDDLIALFDLERLAEGYVPASVFGTRLLLWKEFATLVWPEFYELFEGRDDAPVPEGNFIAFAHDQPLTFLLEIDGPHAGRVLMSAIEDLAIAGNSLLDWAKWRTLLAEAGRVDRDNMTGSFFGEGGIRTPEFIKLGAQLGVDPYGLGMYGPLPGEPDDQ